jgi:NADH:ubiquinone oxidoreductase subunit 6 (subunit J)
VDIHWHSFFFLVFAILACGFALAVVFSANVVRMAFYLVLSLGAVAGLFFLAGADFVGAMQLMIYVGGTLVLLVFGVMLTARKPSVDLSTGGGQWVLAAIVGASLLGVLLQTAYSVDPWKSEQVAAVAPPVAASPTAAPLGLAMLGVRVDQLEQDDPTLRRGMSGYLLAFEIVSVHLVVVLIGAAYLARARRRRIADHE